MLWWAWRSSGAPGPLFQQSSPERRSKSPLLLSKRHSHRRYRCGVIYRPFPLSMRVSRRRTQPSRLSASWLRWSRRWSVASPIINVRPTRSASRRRRLESGASSRIARGRVTSRVVVPASVALSRMGSTAAYRPEQPQRASHASSTAERPHPCGVPRDSHVSPAIVRVRVRAAVAHLGSPVERLTVSVLSASEMERCARSPKTALKGAPVTVAPPSFLASVLVVDLNPTEGRAVFPAAAQLAKSASAG